MSRRPALRIDAGPTMETLVITEDAGCRGGSEEFLAWLESEIVGVPPRDVLIDGIRDQRSMLRTLSLVKRFLAATARLTVADADFASVYRALADAAAIHPEYRFRALVISDAEGDRGGRAFAELEFRRGRTGYQDPATIPVDKDKSHLDDGFAAPDAVMPLATAETMVLNALAGWHTATPDEARRRRDLMNREFPDKASTRQFWHDAVGRSFIEFFIWGHDHDFGFGKIRNGAMGNRHVEIISESLAFGLLPPDLNGVELLDVGCWTGGDVLALAGLGAKVTAFEEHPVSARAAKRLCQLVGSEAKVLHRSLYDDRPELAQRFDVIYCSGVIYHVTDPLLLLRICFAYLRPGGTLVIETKAETGAGADCAYAGTMEKGWNWYSPSRAALGRWLVDAGFAPADVRLHWRPIGRLLAAAVKTAPAALPDGAGFSRPASWLIDEI